MKRPEPRHPIHPPSRHAQRADHQRGKGRELEKKVSGCKEEAGKGKQAREKNNKIKRSGWEARKERVARRTGNGGVGAGGHCRSPAVGGSFQAETAFQWAGAGCPHGARPPARSGV